MLFNIFYRPIWIVTPGRFALEIGLAIGFGVACQIYYSLRLRRVASILLDQQIESAGAPLKHDERMIRRVRRLVFVDGCLVAPALEEAIFRGAAIYLLRYSILLALGFGIVLNAVFALPHGREYDNQAIRRYVRKRVFDFGLKALVIGLLTGSVILPMILHGLANARAEEFFPWQKWSSKKHPFIVITRYLGIFRRIEFRQANDIHDE